MTDNNKTVVVIGVGPCGLSAAYNAQKSGYRVILLEKTDIAGGKGGSRQFKNFTVDFGPHTYHAMTKEITDFMEKHSNGKLVDINIKQRLYITNKPISYPMKISEALFNFGVLLNVKILLDFIFSKIKSIFIKTQQNSFKQFGEVNFGKTLYDLCFGRYTERVFRCSADNISLEYGKRKLPNTSLWDFILSLLTKVQKKNKESYLHVRRYMYHKNGIGNVYEAIAKGIKDRGGETIFNSKISSIDVSEDNKATSVNLELPTKRSIKCDYLVSTIPIDDFVNYTNKKLTDYNFMEKKLRFKHVIVVNAILNKSQFSENHWIYLVNDQFYFNRLSEQKNFSKLCAPENKTLIMLEIILDFEDKEWKWESEKWRAKVEKDLGFLGVNPKEIEDVWITKMEKAYPFFLVGYEKVKEKVLNDFAKFKNVVSTGRNGLFLDINMHDAMVLGAEGFRYLIENKVEEFYKDHKVICIRKRNQ